MSLFNKENSMRRPRISSIRLLGLAAVIVSPLVTSALAQPLAAPGMGNSSASQPFPGPGKVEPAGPLDLASAIDLALSANPALAAAARELQAVEGAVIQAGVRPNPEISTLVEDTQQKATRTTTLQINQAIELGGKRAARIESAERGRDVAAADLAAQGLETRAAVVAAFFDVLVAQERVRLAEALLDLAQRAAQVASRRVAAGKVSPVEETKARVAEASVRVEFNLAQGELAAARKRLAATWGNPAPRFERADGRTEALPTVLSSEEIRSRLAVSPALARARLEVDRRSALAEVERTRRIPNVTVTVGAQRVEELGRNQAIVGLSVPLPLFDRNQGNLLEALRRADKARDELAATEIRLSTEVAQAYERLKALSLEVDTLQKDILPGAQSAYEAASKGYELGKFNFLEVLDAQRTFFQARSQYLRALADAHRASADIDRVLGATTTTEPAGKSQP
ncbi:MAG: TolC family protein [Dechloromonas sp.]|nr:TolC family protein [Dechloromonas sp.]